MKNPVNNKPDLQINDISAEQLQARYKAQIALPNFGLERQLKLNKARILVIGAGALGTSITTNLTGAGIGNIGIVDNDRIEISNLHRQFLYTEQDVGQSKVEVLAKRLISYNPHIRIHSHTNYLDYHNAKDIIKEYELVLDASDNLPTRYVISDTCVLLNRPMIYGAIHGTEARMAVLNYQNGASYRCLYPTQSTSNIADSQLLWGESCQERGVLPTTCMLLGSLQANEALKIIGDYGTVMQNLLIIDSLTGRFHQFQLPKRRKDLQELIFKNYSQPILSLSAEKLRQLQAQASWHSKSQQIIDIRPSHQAQDSPIPTAINISTQTLIELARANFAHSPLATAQEIYLICAQGQQSRILATQLTKLCPQLRFYQVEGGARAYFK